MQDWHSNPWHSALPGETSRRWPCGVGRSAHNPSTVTVAHRFSTIEHCDEILVLDHGRLVARGSYDELLRTSPLFASMAASGNGDGPALVEEEQIERGTGT